MPGNIIGGKKAAKTNLKNDPDFYRRIGSMGGRVSSTGGFASQKVGSDGLTGLERARLAGARGGKKSRRPKVNQ